jgi:predicted DNA-binding transcriptional regulator YafY
LSFNPEQAKFIKSLPLHHSQEILSDTNDEFRIRLKVCITFDFIMEILSHGEDVKVLKPNSFVRTIKRIFQNSLNQYDEIK